MEKQNNTIQEPANSAGSVPFGTIKLTHRQKIHLTKEIKAVQEYIKDASHILKTSSPGQNYLYGEKITNAKIWKELKYLKALQDREGYQFRFFIDTINS